MSQEYVAVKMGVKQSYISKVENNEKDISLKKISEFARILEVEMIELFRTSLPDESNNSDPQSITIQFPDELMEILKKIADKL